MVVDVHVQRGDDGLSEVMLQLVEMLGQLPDMMIIHERDCRADLPS